MKEIQLTKGKVALVDDEDFERINKRQWHALCNKGISYACNRNRAGKPIHMHREVLNAPPDVLIDHKDRNGLNNQKSDLRYCNTNQNLQNQVRIKEGYKGVVKRSGTPYYRSRITYYGKRISLGNFKTAEEAAIAYNRAAIKYFGDFANLNVIKGERRLISEEEYIRKREEFNELFGT